MLRLVPRRKKKGVKWADGVLDNEGMGKKSSKKCCIYHKPRVFGNWSDDEDTDTECPDCNPGDGSPGGASQSGGTGGAQSGSAVAQASPAPGPAQQNATSS